MENLGIIERTKRLIACVDRLVNPQPECGLNSEELREALETAMEEAEVEIDDYERRLNEVEECAALLLHGIEALDNHLGAAEGT